MVQYCCVENCNSKSFHGSVSFHRFPTGRTVLEAHRRKLWIESVALQEDECNYAKICSKHFAGGEPAKFSAINAPNWIPTLMLGKAAGNPQTTFATEMDTSVIQDRQYVEENPPAHEYMVYEDHANHETFLFDLIICEEDGAPDEEELPGVTVTAGQSTKPMISPRDGSVVNCPNDGVENIFEEVANITHQSDLFYEESLTDDMIEEWLEEEFIVDHMVEEWLENDNVEDNVPNGTFPQEHHYDGQDIPNLLQIIENYKNIVKEQAEEIQALQLKVEKQQKVLDDHQLNLKSFEGNDKKTRHFTGLPNFSTLKIVYEFVQGGILRESDILSKEQIFIMVLMRLRLNLFFSTLGYLFRVSVTTACKYFYSGLYSLFKQLQGLVRWPSKESLVDYTPIKFKKVFPNDNITSIIDCFEIYTEKPGTKDAVVKMYSNYKHHYTTKLLISITPFGSISYVSKPYTGRSSDKFITETCGYLDNIDENDLILADRGFSVQKAIQDKGANLKVPDSSTKRRQLTSVAVERTRALASVRNEVERTIGALRGKYGILKGPISITMMNHEHNGINVLHMVVTVCSALFNLCPPIIK